MCSLYFKFDVIKEMVVAPSVRCVMGEFVQDFSLRIIVKLVCFLR